MKLTITFQHLEHTPSLDERIEEKTSKLKRYFDDSFHAKWTCSVKDNFHFADVEILHKGDVFHASAKADNLYKTFDVALSKLEKQVSKRQGRLKNKIHRKKEEAVILDYEQAWSDQEEDAA